MVRRLILPNPIPSSDTLIRYPYPIPLSDTPIRYPYRTRLFLGEAHKFVLFPNGCSMKQMTNLLGLYGGCDSDELRRIRRLPSRWVALCTTFPSLVLYEGGCYLLHSDNQRDEHGGGKQSKLIASGLGASHSKKRARYSAGAGDEEEDEEGETGY